jgi:exodeoxyribonuclease VII small subunit
VSTDPVSEDVVSDNPTDPGTYEQARDQLALVVSTLESGGLTLEQSLALWERGERLAQICDRFLDGARARVEAALARSRTDAGDPRPGDPLR